MAAPKGNKFAVGNNGGRPAIYNDPKKLQIECDGYFEYIKGEWHEEKFRLKDEKTGKPIITMQKVWDRRPEPATITGLALYLGFCGRKMLFDYEDKQEFSDIIKRAKALVELHYEQSLNNQSCTGAIFALKNMGWRDQQQLQIADSEGGQLKTGLPEDKLDELVSLINNLGKV